ncbi:MAG: hypothetical protein NTY19_44475 [Planctomycetota bacterium]|nr:hypothetical protein [Planctomycetota bacterium]
MNPEELDFLIAGWLDGQLTPDQHARLEQALLADPAARQRLQSQSNLDVALREWASTIAISAAWDGRETADGEPLLPGAHIEDGMSCAEPVGRASRGIGIFRKLSRWLTRAALVSLGAGLLIGVLSTSLVWAFTLPRVAGPLRIPLPLADSSFEQQLPVGHRGIPLQSGAWGGDFARITGREQGIVPKDGQHMLRFLRSNFEGEVSELSYVGNMYQVIDLRPWKDAFAEGQTRVELTAWFNAVPGEANFKFRFGAQLFALEESPEELSTPSSSGWLTRNNVAFSAHRNVLADDDPVTWQRVTTELRLPPQTQFLVMHVEVARMPPSRKPQPVEFAGHYVDAVELVLHTERKPR